MSLDGGIKWNRRNYKKRIRRLKRNLVDHQGQVLLLTELQKINEDILTAHVLHMKTPHFSFAVG